MRALSALQSVQEQWISGHIAGVIAYKESSDFVSINAVSLEQLPPNTEFSGALRWARLGVAKRSPG